MGPAGGLDKSARHLKAWWALGAGFIEVGTVTPLPQKKNPGVFIKRDWNRKILWNNMGFPGKGADTVSKRLKQLKFQRPTPLFINIGKNRTTPIESAEKDYLSCISTLHSVADAFVINISSPNTKNLKDLAKPALLKKLLTAIQQKLQSLETPKPFFVKWGIDREEKDFLSSLDIALECGAEGHIVCNSSSQREKSEGFPPYGGVSGAPLKDISIKRLLLLQKHLGAERKNQLLISVGGVLKPKEVWERRALGADLVQTYSGLVFEGPYFFRKALSHFSSGGN